MCDCFEIREVSTYTVRLYMAGDISSARRHLSAECYPPNDGLCVTIEQTTFIYTGGCEEGFMVGFVNYPRFPTTPDALFSRALLIAKRLIPALQQWSALLVSPDKRVATDGTPNACSALYGACRRATFALGYGRLVTYTLQDEGGVSLRAAGFRCLGIRGGGSWNCPSRPRVDKSPTQRKLFWESTK